MEDEHNNGRYVSVHFLDHLLWASNLSEHMNVLRLTQPFRQSSNLLLKSLFNQLAIVHTVHSLLTVQIMCAAEQSVQGLWKSFTSKTYRHVDLKTMILCPKNKLMDKHNEAALNAFLVP